jgi:hypothetical protein
MATAAYITELTCAVAACLLCGTLLGLVSLVTLGCP